MAPHNHSPNIVKEIDLSCSARHAFTVFTKRFAIWWPLREHSCFAEAADRVEIEERVGGMVTEFSRTGETRPWGKILSWNPPTSFSMTWHPASPAEEATVVTVEFRETSDTSCQLTLVHSQWHNRKDPTIRDGYAKGWNGVLALFVKALSC